MSRVRARLNGAGAGGRTELAALDPSEPLKTKLGLESQLAKARACAART